MAPHYPLQNMREGDRSASSGGSSTTTTTTAPHPLPLSLASANISDCPFASRSTRTSDTDSGIAVSECPIPSVSATIEPITGEVFSAKSVPPANPLPSYPASETLVSSPYPEQSHHLNLSTIPWNYRLLALALTHMTNAIPTFTTSAYDISFNWGAVISTTRALHEKFASSDKIHGTRIPTEHKPFPRTTAYVIVFRSRRALPLIPTTTARLGELDSLAHEEAAVSGGLLKYWFGSPNTATGRNLATCLWVDHEHAVRGGGGPGHRKAMREARGMYVGWDVERLRLIIEEGAEEYRFEKW